ncbi:MAG: NAD(P)/FAD-dependent oxidoreductase [Planctomycetota bacterium]|nr:NAD(P)/FAD-dependent oxidoreductase [Planctomycetota bacterium]
MDRCDALIVGGGPAGSTCARDLVRAGLDVVVLDKQAFPRDKTCAGWITPAVVAELELDTADYAKSRVFQPISGFRTGAIGGRSITLGYPSPVSFGIRRREFDEFLLSRCGARLLLGERIDSLERTDEGWLVNGRIATRLLVGAGGHFCPVARHLGSSKGSETVVAAQEVEFHLSETQRDHCRVNPAVPELYFCGDLAGYAWCFRKGDYLNVGLGREDNTRLSEHVAKFREWMIERGRIPRDTPERFHGHAYILYGHAPRPPCADAALLIGDAAGLAYSQSGEGIRPAVESAIMAAQVIVAAKADYCRANLEPYAQKLRARFGKPHPASGASAWLPAPIRNALSSHLLASPWFTRHVVMNRWFLHAGQSALGA